MARRFLFGNTEQQEPYNPSQMTPRVKRNFSFEENDDRFYPRDEAEEETETDPYQDIISRYRSTLTGQSPALTRYRSGMQNMPKREEYDLGKMGKLGAALAGFGAGFRNPAEGIVVARSLRDAPYKRALEDYSLEMDNLGNEAQFEHDDRTTKLKGLDLELEALKDNRTFGETQRVNSSLINRRGVQNESDRAKSGLDRDRFNMDFADTNHDNTLADAMGQSLRNYRVGQTENAKGNLNMRGKEFGLNTDKFGHAKEMDLLNLGQRQTEEFGRNKRDSNNGTNSWITPSAEETANELTAAEMAREFPQYRQFFNIRSGYAPELNDELDDEILNSPEYIQMMMEFKGRVNKRLNNKRGGSSGRFEELNQ